MAAKSMNKSGYNVRLAAGTITFTLSNGDNTAAISASVTDITDLRSVKDAINAVAGTTGITAEMDSSSNAGVVLTHSSGADIILTGLGNTVASGDLDFAALDADGASIAAALTVDVSDTSVDDVLAYGQLDFSSHKAFTVGTVEDDDTEGFLRATSNTASLSAVSAVSIGTASGAESAISVIDGAINKINQSRADLGAISNRLDSTISNLSNVATNVQGSMSNIRDADFSLETSKLTRAQILNQAATSMLAQANSSKQSVLALLQG